MLRRPGLGAPAGRRGSLAAVAILRPHQPGHRHQPVSAGAAAAASAMLPGAACAAPAHRGAASPSYLPQQIGLGHRAPDFPRRRAARGAPPNAASGEPAPPSSPEPAEPAAKPPAVQAPKAVTGIFK
eukprot:352428-Chlamydomonas_euryale.AAC.10